MRLLTTVAALLAVSLAGLLNTSADARVEALVATASVSGNPRHAPVMRRLLQLGALPPPVPNVRVASS